VKTNFTKAYFVSENRNRYKISTKTQAIIPPIRVINSNNSEKKYYYTNILT